MFLWFVVMYDYYFKDVALVFSKLDGEMYIKLNKTLNDIFIL